MSLFSRRAAAAGAAALAFLMLAMLACTLPLTVQLATGSPTAPAATQLPAPTGEAALPAQTAVISRPVTGEISATTVITATAMPTLTRPGPLAQIPNVDVLKAFLLELINEDRGAAGLAPVALDDVADRAAQAHADEMARYLYMSHWDLAGSGPDRRYTEAGGLDAVQENVYMYWQRYDNGQPAPIDNWPDVLRKAETSLMDSPGHRENILAPEHTHVGLGLAYNPETGDMRLDQLFVNRYITLEPVSIQAKLGQTITLRGDLGPGVTQPLLNLAYEPLPKPMTAAELNRTGVYSSSAEIYEAQGIYAAAQWRFETQVKLDHGGRPGLYYVRLWVQSKFGEIISNEIVIEVR